MDNPQQPEPQRSSQETANIDQALTAAYKLNDWLNFYWNFYVVFVGVVFGWLFSSSNVLETLQKVVITLFFAGFAGVSLV